MEGAKLFDNISFSSAIREHTQGWPRMWIPCAANTPTSIPQITGALETYRNSADPGISTSQIISGTSARGLCTLIGGVAGAKNPEERGVCFTAQPDTLFANGLARMDRMKLALLTIC